MILTIPNFIVRAIMKLMQFRHVYRTCVCVALFGLTGTLSADQIAPEVEILPKELQKLTETYLENPTIVSSISPDDNSSHDFEMQLPTKEEALEQKRLSLPPSSERGLGEQPAFQHIQDIEVELQGPYAVPNCAEKEGYTVNFEDISVIQLIQFISKISGTNFVFDSGDLQFNITIISEESTSVDDLSAALFQVLKMHGLSVVEQGNNVLIYKNQNLSKVSTIITDANIKDACDAAVITRVFRLYNVDPVRIQSIVRPLVSSDAIVEVSIETRHLIVSDITANVEKIADLLAALDMPNATFEISEYRVKSAYPSALVAYAKEILAPIAAENPIRFIAQPSSNKIFVVSTPYLINKAKQVLEALDTADITEVNDLGPVAMENNNLYMYKLKYQNGLEIAEAVREIGMSLQYMGVSNPEFVNTINSIQWLEVNNSIVVTGSASAVQKVVALLEELDEPPKQVFVEVLIIDTTLTNSLDFGVQWIALGDEQNKLAYASGLLANAPPNPNLQSGGRSIASSVPPKTPIPGTDLALPVPSQLQGNANTDATEAFGFGIIGNILRHNGQSFLTLGALVSALDEEAATKIVLNPRIMVQDNQPASLFVGQNIPYQTTSTVIQQTGSVTQNIQYEDVGVQLDVIPTISPNNIVTLQINQSVADVVTATSANSLTPTTNKTLTTTRVHVPDGTFLVMSGNIREQTTDIRSGIPCLGTLPLIGPLFSRNVEQCNRRNLIMFIRPRVITNTQEGLDLTNEEGYDYNWETNPCSMSECGSTLAPETETYPPIERESYKIIEMQPPCY